LKKVIAWVMLIVSSAGLILSSPWIRVIGKQEPPLVLALSWFAWVFAAVDALLIEHKD
jgi:hypothetical protein